MNKYLKYTAYLAIAVALVASASVYAREGNDDSEDSSRDSVRAEVREAVQERQENMAEVNKLREENRIETEKKKEEMKMEIEKIKDEADKMKEERDEMRKDGDIEGLENSREEFKNQVKATIEEIKIKREEFKTELEKNKEAVKQKREEIKNTFRNSLSVIKDEAKKISTEKIFNSVTNLNTTLTEKYSDKIDQIETVLLSIESRISKAESAGIDVSTVKASVEKAKTAINTAREATLEQSKKVYEVSITDEATLKNNMTALRDIFKKDIEAVKEQVKNAHIAVSDVATTLAKIPKIDEISITDDNEQEEAETTDTPTEEVSE